VSEIHNFKAGDIVVVFSTEPSGKAFIEARRALIIALRAGEDMYEVKFQDNWPDRFTVRPFVRYVDPAAQEDPEGYLELLNKRGAK
jgi:hypothetical protein